MTERGRGQPDHPRPGICADSRAGAVHRGMGALSIASLREGKVAALADYAEHGRIRAGSAEKFLEAAAQAYVAHRLEGRGSLLIARSHELRREACRRVRGGLQHLGGPSIEIADGQRATVGDLIVCTRNDHSVDAAEGKTLANMHVLRIESIIPVGPVV